MLKTPSQFIWLGVFLGVRGLVPAFSYRRQVATDSNNSQAPGLHFNHGSETRARNSSEFVAPIGTVTCFTPLLAE